MGSLTYTSNVLNNRLLSQSCILGQLLEQGKHWDARSKDRGVGEEPLIDWPAHRTLSITGFHDLLQCQKVLQVSFCVFVFFTQAIGTLEMESVPYSSFYSSIHLTADLAFQTFFI